VNRSASLPQDTKIIEQATEHNHAARGGADHDEFLQVVLHRQLQQTNKQQEQHGANRSKPVNPPISIIA
jgi:hypothetical protein